MVKHIVGGGVVAVLLALGACNTSGASGDCGTLTTCCAQLTNASNKELCTQVVSAGDATSCGEAQSDFEGDELCVVTASAGSSGGGGSGCSGLSACCGSLTSTEQAGCDAIVSEGNDSVCTEELSAYKDSGLCGGGSTSASTGGGSGCSGLSSCCSSLPSSEQPGCDAIVNEANDTVCTEELSAYKTAGSCGGGSGTTGGTGGTGGSGGSGCSGLSSCCSQLPSADQPTCNALVSEGNDSVCSEELTAYTTDGLCH